MQNRRITFIFSAATVANATLNSSGVDMMGCDMIGAALTISGTSIQCSAKVQGSNDGTNWFDMGSTLTISTAGTFGFPIISFVYALARLQVISTDADVITLSANATIKSSGG